MTLKNFFQSFWGGVITVFIFALFVYLLFGFFYQGEISFNIIGPNEVKAGEIAEFRFIYVNNSRTALENVEIVVLLPSGIISVEAPETRNIVINLERILSKTSGEKTLKLMALMVPEKSQVIHSSFHYRPKNLTAVFEKKAEKVVFISGSVFNLNLSLPKQVFVEQFFSLVIHWENLTNQAFADMRLKGQWPSGFSLKEANPRPREADNLWQLGELGPAAQGRINLQASLFGSSGESKQLVIVLETLVGREFFPIAQQEGFISLIEHPLALSTLVNGDIVYNADLGEQLEFKINFQNNFTTALRDLIIKTQLEGEIFDFRTLKTSHQGFFTLRDRTIIWRGATVPQLYVLNPGERGEISFSVQLKNENQYSFRHPDQKNIVLEVKTTIESSTIPPQLEGEGPVKTGSLVTIKLNTQPALVIGSYFRDAPSGILNIGSLPLRVGQATSFTIHWQIKNTFNALSSVEIKTVLPQGVEFTGRIAGDYGESAPVYNERTREITWLLASVPAGSGVLTKPLTAVFQIKVTPFLHQVNQAIPLTEAISLTATDVFTRKNFQLHYEAIKSTALTDKTVLPGDGIVRQ